MYEKAVRVRNTYFNQISNVPYKSHIFCAMSRGPEEATEQFITRFALNQMTNFLTGPN